MMVKKVEDTPEVTPDEVAMIEEVAEEITEEEAAGAEGSAAKPTKTAKAGKRSAKAAKEAEELDEKAARKAEIAAKEDAPRPKQKPRVKKYSKNQKAMRAEIEADKLYDVTGAVALLKKISKAKFDPTLEIHVRLDIDPRQADQMVRASTVLPAGSGKIVKVAVLTTDDKKLDAAVKAGAIKISQEDLLTAIGKGVFDFDTLVATPDMMPQLGRHAKALGPKGLMPSPKSGTVTADPANAVSEIQKGRLEVKNDANGIVHAALGKLSFTAEDLESNVRAVLTCVQQNRPSGVKGTYVRSISLSATMTPGVKIDPAEMAKK
ncbi:MAG: 50S ribosomal protein L1 [Candidatus Saccharibacteria bacterium]